MLSLINNYIAGNLRRRGDHVMSLVTSDYDELKP